MKEEKKKYSKRGNPFKRGNTWTFIYYVFENNKKIQKSKGGFRTKNEAEQAKKEMEAKIIRNEYVPSNKLTVEDYCTQWFNTHKVTIAPNTENGYRVNIFNHIIPFIGNIRLSELRPEDVMALYEQCNLKGMSSTATYYVHRVLRQALDSAKKNKLIYENVCRLIPNPPKPRKHSSPQLTNEQYNLLFDCIKKSKYDLPLLLCGIAGLRKGESLGVRECDFYFEQGYFKLHQQVTKDNRKEAKNKIVIKGLKTNGSYRIVPIPENLSLLVLNKINKNKELYKDSYFPTDLIFRNENGEVINPERLNKEMNKISKVVGVHITVHDLRHIAAEKLLEKGLSLKAIQQMLGHSTITTTIDIYGNNADFNIPLKNAMSQLLQ